MNSMDLAFDPVYHLRSRWRRVAVVAVIVAAGAAGYAFAVPRWYSSHLSVVPSPPKTPGGMSLLGGGVGGGLGALGGAIDLSEFGMGGTDAERVAAIFKSTQVSDAVIAEFDLIHRYRDDYIEEARDDLWDHCSAKVEKKSGVVTLVCEDKSPETARSMLAFFGKNANETLLRISTSSAAEERRFLEQRVAQAHKDLDAAASNLREFSEKNRVVDIGAQARAVVETMAQLHGELIAKQMELSFVESYSAPGESTSTTLANRIAILQSQLAGLENADSPGATGAGSDAGSAHAPDKAGHAAKRGAQANDPGIFPSAASVPRLQVELAQRLREVKTQETLFLFLTQMYEMARVSEARSTPTFQVLDPPALPAKHSRPKRLLIILGGLLLGIVIGVSWVVGGAWRRSTQRRPSLGASGSPGAPGAHDAQ